jgi:hypothetical protein
MDDDEAPNLRRSHVTAIAIMLLVSLILVVIFYVVSNAYKINDPGWYPRNDAIYATNTAVKLAIDATRTAGAIQTQTVQSGKR